MRLHIKDLEKQIDENDYELEKYSKEMRKLLKEDANKAQQIEDLKIIVQDTKNTLARVQEVADKKAEKQIDEVKEVMNQMNIKFQLYREVVGEEVKVNEMLR